MDSTPHEQAGQKMEPQKKRRKKRVDRLFAAPAKLAEAGFLFATNTRTSV
jgi:hypothetical protein